MLKSRKDEQGTTDAGVPSQQNQTTATSQRAMWSDKPAFGSAPVPVGYSCGRRLTRPEDQSHKVDGSRDIETKEREFKTIGSQKTTGSQQRTDSRGLSEQENCSIVTFQKHDKPAFGSAPAPEGYSCGRRWMLSSKDLRNVNKKEYEMQTVKAGCAKFLEDAPTDHIISYPQQKQTNISPVKVPPLMAKAPDHGASSLQQGSASEIPTTGSNSLPQKSYLIPAVPATDNEVRDQNKEPRSSEEEVKELDDDLVLMKNVVVEFQDKLKESRNSLINTVEERLSKRKEQTLNIQEHSKKVVKRMEQLRIAELKNSEDVELLRERNRILDDYVNQTNFNVEQLKQKRHELNKQLSNLKHESVKQKWFAFTSISKDQTRITEKAYGDIVRQRYEADELKSRLEYEKAKGTKLASKVEQIKLKHEKKMTELSQVRSTLATMENEKEKWELSTRRKCEDRINTMKKEWEMMSSQVYEKSREKVKNLTDLRERVTAVEARNKEAQKNIWKLRRQRLAQKDWFSKEVEQMKKNHSVEVKNLQSEEDQRVTLEKEELPGEWVVLPAYSWNSDRDSRSELLGEHWNDTMFQRASNRGFSGLNRTTEGEWKGKFDFIWLGDAQLGFSDQKKEEWFTQIAVNFINDWYSKHLIKFVVVCGGHTHNFEDLWDKKLSLEVNRRKRRQQLASYKRIWCHLNPEIPLVCVCGNHDVGNKPNQRTIDLYTEEFGDDYIAFWAGGVKFITVNSQLIQHPEESGDLASRQEDWFGNELNEKNCRKIVFSHIPPFCWHPDERESYFNWPQERRKKWLDSMVAAGIKNVYCAHYHRRAEGTYKDLKVMVAGALGTSIFTKDIPPHIKGNKVDEASFKVSNKGAFGGLGVDEDASGLYVVTVSKKEVTEKWMSVSEMYHRELWGQPK